MSTENPPRKEARGVRLAMEAAAWFFANTLDVFLIVRDGIIERASPSMANFLGWEESEGIGRPFSDFVHPKDLDIVLEAVEESVRCGSAIYEHRVLTKSGDWRWARVRLKRSGDGSSIVVMQDISRERRRLQEAAEAGSAYKLLSTASGVGLWRYHPQTDECEFDPDFSSPFLETPEERRVPLSVARGAIHIQDAPAVN